MENQTQTLLRLKGPPVSTQTGTGAMKKFSSAPGCWRPWDDPCCKRPPFTAHQQRAPAYRTWWYMLPFHRIYPAFQPLQNMRTSFTKQPEDAVMDSMFVRGLPSKCIARGAARALMPATHLAHVPADSQPASPLMFHGSTGLPEASTRPTLSSHAIGLQVAQCLQPFFEVRLI